VTSDSPHLRFAIVGIVTVSLFAALFARLWFLQVMTAPQYQVAADNNRIRVVHVEAPRGRIIDRNKHVLVDNRRSIEVLVDWQAYRKLQPPEQQSLLTRLAKVLTADAQQQMTAVAGTGPRVVNGTTSTSSSTTTSTTTTTTSTTVAGQAPVTPPAAAAPLTVKMLQHRLNNQRYSHFKPVPVAIDVSEGLEIYLAEHADQFPTVTADSVTVRQYHYGSLLAHVLGYVGPLNAEDLKQYQNPSKPYDPSDEVGKAGIERTMESDLRGTPGVIRYEVDARNRPVRELSGSKAPVPGNDVYLSIDINLQYIVEKALAAQIKLSGTQCDRSGCYHGATTGASVVTDPRNGQVLAMASYPTYDPSVFTGGISEENYRALTSDANGSPLLNRAIAGEYAPGSTWKLFTADAALSHNETTPDFRFDDPGYYTIPDCKIGKCQVFNAGHTAHGTVDLSEALTVSSDAYFYRLGDLMWRHRNFLGDTALADTYKLWGFGRATGVGLAGERAGLLPTPAEKQALAEALHKGDQAAIDENKVWRSGDNINAAIGQGYVQVTPMQLVNGYATFANGGTLYQPTLVAQVLEPFSSTVVGITKPTVVRTIPMQPAWRLSMVAGFEGVTQSNLGTAVSTFAGFPQATFPVAGKTGTAQVAKKGDTSLFVAFAPATDPHFAAVAILPQAGQGGSAAAPLVRRILEPIAKAGGDLSHLPEAPLGGSFDVDQAINEISAPSTGGFG